MSHLVCECWLLCVFCNRLILKQASFFSFVCICFGQEKGNIFALAVKNIEVNFIFLARLCLSLQSNLRILYIYEYN